MTRHAGARRVMVVGGGMAGLAAAWELTRPGRPGPPVEVTVVQRGWRPGGKAASSRAVGGGAASSRAVGGGAASSRAVGGGAGARIEEHGLHVWLGWYDNAFRLLRDCYDELDRARTDPACPMRRWSDAFEPAPLVGVADRLGGSPWVADFSVGDGLPGDPGGAGPTVAPDVFAARAVSLVRDLLSSMLPPAAPSTVLSASPTPPPGGPDPRAAARSVQLGALAVAAGVASSGAAVAATLLEPMAGRDGSATTVLAAAVDELDRIARDLRSRLDRREEGRRWSVVADLLLGCVRGMVADRLLDPARGYRAIDHLDFRDWLSAHGVAGPTLDSGLVAGMYDLVFAYEGGRHDRPRFAAGQGLELSSRFFFAPRGALFWKMRAGMGEAVVAPLVQVLRRRGVRFRMGTELVRLELDRSAPRLAAVHLRRQRGALDAWDDDGMFVPVGGVPCFPTGPAALEREGGAAGPVHAVRLGEDVDVVVLATSIGAVPTVAADVVAGDERWHEAVARVGTVATASAQVWFDRSESALGLAAPGATLSGFGPPFDTYASMSHLLPAEGRGRSGPRGLAYLCGVLPDAVAGAGAVVRHEEAEAEVRRRLDEWARGAGRAVLPDLDEGSVVDRHVVAATDPSDRYVQSLPGSRAARLAASGSGVAGLVLAGDWTDNGIDAGCIEAAVVSGVQAANAARGTDAGVGVVGGWRPSAPDESVVAARTWAGWDREGAG